MNRFPLRLRFTLANLMIALAVFAITLAVVTRSVTSEVWPTYMAGAWVYARASVHDPQTHAALEREFRSQAVLDAALADPSVSALPRFHGASDSRAELARLLHVQIHPVFDAKDTVVVSPRLERILVTMESHSQAEAVIITDAVAAAYCGVLGPTRFISMERSAQPGGSLRLVDPILDRPWKVCGAMILGVALSTLCLFIPTHRKSRSMFPSSNAAPEG
ncbi:MAG: hypothetical protein ACHRXM_13450 [Isosphaerales bacterium]